MKNANKEELTQRDYPVQENIRWIKTAWISERLGYLLLGGFILFAVLGGLSQGILSDRLYHNDQENISVRYEKLLRNSSETDILIMFPTANHSQNVLTLKGNFIKDYDIEYISPDNIRVITTPDGIALYPPREGSGALTSVKVTFRPSESGRYHLDLFLDGRNILQINQYVLP